MLNEKTVRDTGRNTSPTAKWHDPSETEGDKLIWKRGKILLGRVSQEVTNPLIGVADDRHIVTIAGSRAGKSRTSLIPNLMLWAGSFITIDPKGELAEKTAMARKRAGHDVYIIDPFEEVKGEAAQLRANFNPLAEMQSADTTDHVDEAAIMADALILADNGKNDHWIQSARNLTQGLLLWLMQMEGQKSLIDLRNLLSSSLKPSEHEISLGLVLSMMAENDAYEGVVANTGASFSGKPDNEAASIQSSAIEQMAFLRSSRLAQWISASDFQLKDLKERPTSIYLVLPASRLATHYRWLRLLIMQALNALERHDNRTGHPVLFVLEEFPILGYVRQLEAAAGLMAGYGVKIWTVMQDLQQIKTHYPNSWETFLGNAGIIEAFGNVDTTTTKYLSDRLGQTLTVQNQKENLSLDARSRGAPGERETTVNVPLLAPFEITQTFHRETGKKLVLIPEYRPMIIERTALEDLRE